MKLEKIREHKEYFEPDNRWEPYVIDKKDYLNKFVVIGKFHNDVPKDVINAFTTVEYLLAHAYYFWPIYDEAFTKALIVLEMAVKIKAKELDISLDKKRKNGKVVNKNLESLIDEVCEYLKSDTLKWQLHRARKRRNMIVHKDRNSFIGAMGKSKENLYHFVNVLNLLFLNENELNLMETNQNKVIEIINKIANPLVILDYQNVRILIKEILHINLKHFQYKKLLQFVCIPVLVNTIDHIKKGHYPDPLVISSIDFKITESGIYGATIDGFMFSIVNSTQEDHLEKLNAHLTDVEKLDNSEKIIYKHHNETYYQWNIEKNIYDLIWIEKQN